MADNLGELSYEEIGERLGRNPKAIEIIRIRKDIPSASKKPGWLTGMGVTKILGNDIHSVILYNKYGILDFDKVPGDRGILRIKKLRLYMWAINPENWIYFKYENVKDRHLKRLLTLARERWDDEWWTPGQAGAYFGVDSGLINNRILNGTLPAKRWGNWWIKRSDVVRLHIQPGKAGYKYQFTPRADAFILKAVDQLGYTYVLTAKLIGVTDNLVARRYKELKEGKEND